MCAVNVLVRVACVWQCAWRVWQCVARVRSGRMAATWVQQCRVLRGAVVRVWCCSGVVCACGVCVWRVCARVATARLPQGYSGARSVQGGAASSGRAWAVCVAREVRVGGAGQWLERVAVEQGAVRGSGARRARGAVRGSGAVQWRSAERAERAERSAVRGAVRCVVHSNE